MMNKTILTGFVFLVILLSGCGPKYVTINPLKEPLSEYPFLVIGDIEDALPEEPPPEEPPPDESASSESTSESRRRRPNNRSNTPDRPTTEVAEKLRGFLKEEISNKKLFLSVSTVDPGSSGLEGNLILTGKFLKYHGGSRAARYFVGFGAGTSEIVVQLSLHRAIDGKELFTGNFKGKISGGLFGGSNDEPLKQISRIFAKFIKDEWKGGKEKSQPKPETKNPDDGDSQRSRDRRSNSK